MAAEEYVFVVTYEATLVKATVERNPPWFVLGTGTAVGAVL